MLRKGSRGIEEQSKGQFMGNLTSSSCFSEAATVRQWRSARFFSFPGVLVSTTTKGSPEMDSMKSPTSPLDLGLFANLGSSLFRSQRPSGKSWDCGRVGLRDLPELVEKKNVLLGSQKRVINMTSTQNYTKSVLPELGKVDSSCADATWHQNPNFDVVASDQMCSEFSKSMAEHTYGCLGHLPPREIELSEDYTCIISHGPNPKTTHIFGDCILESYMMESEYPKAMRGLGVVSPFPCNEFLSFCCFCNAKLEDSRDIYMYRGEKAFCSWDCRDQVMTMEAEMELDKPATGCGDSPRSSSFHEARFLEHAFACPAVKATAVPSEKSSVA